MKSDTKQQFKNPAPVVVGLVEIDGGLLVVRRAIEPGKGKLALPGGYLEHEDWKAGLIREVREETLLDISSATIQLDSIESVREGQIVLIFARVKGNLTVPVFVPNDEVSEISVIRSPEEMAFPSHTSVVKRFFEK